MELQGSRGGSGTSVWRLERCHTNNPLLCCCLCVGTWSWGPAAAWGGLAFILLHYSTLLPLFPLHTDLFKRGAAVGRAGPVHGGEHRARTWALGNILGTGVRQMRSAVPSVGYRNWVVLKRNVI